MFQLTTKLPEDCIVAVSGGADSMALLHFVTQNRKRKVGAAIFDHGTGFFEKSSPLVLDFCANKDIPVYIGRIGRDKLAEESWEEYWRNERYEFLRGFEKPVLVGHNLDDVVETYLWSALNGEPRLIPSENGQIRRPFLSVTHDELVQYCIRNNVNYIDDPSNKDFRYKRTQIRYGLKREALKVHEGFYSVIRRKVCSQEK
jgi:tRNA(Ile)-lysidine synthase